MDGRDSVGIDLINFNGFGVKILQDHQQLVEVQRSKEDVPDPERFYACKNPNVSLSQEPLGCDYAQSTLCSSALPSPYSERSSVSSTPALTNDGSPFSSSSTFGDTTPEPFLYSFPCTPSPDSNISAPGFPTDPSDLRGHSSSKGMFSEASHGMRFSHPITYSHTKPLAESWLESFLTDQSSFYMSPCTSPPTSLSDDEEGVCSMDGIDEISVGTNSLCRPCFLLPPTDSTDSVSFGPAKEMICTAVDPRLLSVETEASVSSPASMPASPLPSLPSAEKPKTLKSKKSSKAKARSKNQPRNITQSGNSRPGLPSSQTAGLLNNDVPTAPSSKGEHDGQKLRVTSPAIASEPSDCCFPQRTVGKPTALPPPSKKPSEVSVIKVDGLEFFPGGRERHGRAAKNGVDYRESLDSDHVSSLVAANPKKRRLAAPDRANDSRGPKRPCHSDDEVQPKPHICLYSGCPRRFQRHHDLERHLSTIHGNEFPFHCLNPKCFTKKAKKASHAVYKTNRGDALRRHVFSSVDKRCARFYQPLMEQLLEEGEDPNKFFKKASV